MSGSCDFDFANKGYYGMRVFNNSSTSIMVCGAYILPDTLLPKQQLTTVKILPGKCNEIEDYHLNDKKLGRFDTEKITLFILDDQVYQTLPLDTIHKYNMVLKRYEIDKNDYRNLVVDICKGYALLYP